MDQSQIKENVTLEQALRRANLLAAAAEVSQNLTHILNIDELLPKTVDIICNAYDFYYAGVFLINATGDFAVLRAGRGEPGRIMMENHHKLAVGGNSMIGACTRLNQARISLDVDTEKVWYPNPVLPETRSEMALPLAVGNRVIGAVTVQSVEAAAFSDEDVASLQAMANQLAIAIDNANQRRQLEEAHAELLRAKTFEAIATATGDAIHWIGNKAEPMGRSIERVRQDAKTIVAAAAQLLPPAAGGEEQPLAQLIRKEAAAILAAEPQLSANVEKLNAMPLEKLEKRLSLFSILDDLEIIEDSARLILKVKEDLIGPAREQAPRPTMIDDVLQDAVSGLNFAGLVTVNASPKLPLVLADPVQLNRVFVNLLKNAYEAMEHQPHPQITVNIAPAENARFVAVSITDNGCGIAAADLDKIWITFHTTKGIKGHSGLGLPACRLILQQLGGEITASSTPEQGSTFTALVPVQPATPSGSAPKGRAKILIIDDRDRWHNFAGVTLSNAGFKVTSCGSDYGFEQPTQFDLILLDDILAAGDSLGVLTALKNQGVMGRVLAVSSNPRVERTKDRMLLGLKNLLPKPYTPAELFAAISTALG